MSFDGVAHEYASLKQLAEDWDCQNECAIVERYSGSPTLYSVIGDLRAQQNGQDTIRILDVGCGEGIHSRQLVERFRPENGDQPEVQIRAIDISSEMIRIADEAAHSEEQRKRIKYEVLDIRDLADQNHYDLVLANFVLQFANDINDLAGFCRRLCAALKQNGRMVGWLPNGTVEFLKTVASNDVTRKYGSQLVLPSAATDTMRDGDQVTIEFFADGKTVAKASMRWFYRHTYEKCLLEAGFRSFNWHAPTVTSEGVQRLGTDYWVDWLQIQPWSLVEAVK